MTANWSAAEAVVEETLDPDDWTEVATLAHRIVDDSVMNLQEVRSRPVWKEMPAGVAAGFDRPLPREPRPLAEVYREVLQDVMPYPMGNVHPRFWAWYMGSSNMTGALADFLAAIQGSNLAGGNHAAVLLDRQVVGWCKEMVGFPQTASGTLVSGGSEANLIGLTVARNVEAGFDIRELGAAALAKPLRFYGSNQMHSCHRRAIEALGLGNRALLRIATDGEFRIDISALRTAIAEDRANGVQPACVIANAGTVNTGAIDDIDALATLAAEEDLWLHVDGCIGALLAIAPGSSHLVAGLGRADSIALDPHKWLHAPFDVGCALIRNASSHRQAFATTPEYLESTPRGLAAGPWLHEFGLQTTRGFRALKVWMALKEHGIEKFGRLIDQNIRQARHLAQLVAVHPLLTLVTPTTINIVCFRFDPGDMEAAALKALNIEIMLRLQEKGVAVLSDTTLGGRHCLRAAICNHRTRREDVELLVDEVVLLGNTLTNRK